MLAGAGGCVPSPCFTPHSPACLHSPRLCLPPSRLYRSRDQQYAASRKLLALAGVRLRQHIFRRPIVLRLTNGDAKRQAAVPSGAGGGGSGGSGAIDGAAADEAAADEAGVAPALAAVLQNGSTAAAGGAGAGTAAKHGRWRRRGRPVPQQKGPAQ